ncbi:MAG: WecB/TagA/CpsF family glycosyltransferase, partial [Planctomycetales bacterium]|nr:WecB/TagA/CpsF family glycosyltransferase [Planctomycetales bacterium]
MTEPHNLLEQEPGQDAACAVHDPPSKDDAVQGLPAQNYAVGREAARHNVLGVGISDINLDTATSAIREHLHRRDTGYVCVTGVHGVMIAQDCDHFRGILNNSFLTTPDGMPMVWVGKWNRCREIERVYGPDLMLEVLRDGVASGRTHYLYGGGDGVAEKLAARLRQLVPGVQIVGTYTPPFRPLNEQEEQAIVEEVDRLRPDCFWVGLSTPKQERFMDEYLPKLNTRLMFGVGAAFDFHAGLLRQAPGWMQRSGLESFFRLCMEPRRLWKRYVYGNSRFVARIAGQLAAGRPAKPLTATITAPTAQRDLPTAQGGAADAEDPRDSQRAPGLSVVVPLYNESQCVRDLVDSLDAMQKSTDQYDLQFVFVDDASTDDTLAVLRDAAQRYAHVRILPFRRNGGSGTARRIGTQQ